MTKRRSHRMAAILLCMALIAGLIPGRAFASESRSEAISDKGIYVSTLPVPAEAVTYAKESIGPMIYDFYSEGTVTVGQPFTVKGHDCDLYYFLVFSGNSLVGYYRVFETEEGYTGIFSEDTEFIMGFEKLKGMTSPSSPAKIQVGDYEDIYAVTLTKVVSVCDDPMGNATAKSKIKEGTVVLSVDNKEEQIKNIAKPIDYTVAYPMSKDYSKYLDIGFAETQGSEPWCAAYVTASICRFVKKSSTIKAKTVMKATYPKLTDAELKKKSLSRAQAIAYGKSKGLSPKQSVGRCDVFTVMTELLKNQPIYFGCESKSGSRHALLCRGYNNMGDTPFYSIWNPWYTKYEKIYSDTNTYTTPGGTKYTYDVSIYGWG